MSATKSSGSFRDTLATMDRKGKRIWIYPVKPKGKLYTARTVVSYFLLAFLFGAPFLQIQGNPFLQFDILHRRFFILGMIFWPQDFYLLVLAAITFVVLIFLFTAAYGRLFCGWICPQTIFMEMVFRKIEFLIEGEGSRQRLFDLSPMTGSKFVRKAIKHVIFFCLSFLVGNTLLSYFVGATELLHIISGSPIEHLTGLAFMLLFTLIFYGIFVRFREQACTLVCPYGRLQSVLLDSNSIVISYDFKRGEPRGPVTNASDRADRGDCIDCAGCVRVCPTGIDIRNGTQLECVNCTACIDACNRVMDRVGFPRGLIRYSSNNIIANRSRMTFNLRLKVYSALLVILSSLLIFLLAGRHVVETTVLRVAGSMYAELDNGAIRNLYTVSVVNKTARDLAVKLRLKGNVGELTVVGPPLDVKPQAMSESVFSVQIPRERLLTAIIPIVVEVVSDGKIIDEVRTNFVGPEPKRSHE